MVAAYLTVGQRITPAMLRAAGIIDRAGKSDEAVVFKLSTNDLLAVAGERTVRDRVAALRALADRIHGVQATDRREAEPAAIAPEQRLVQIRDQGGLHIRVRKPMRTLEPEVASELITRELAPAIVAAVDQAQGAADGPGYFAEFTDSRTVLILPREVEALTARQLETLVADVENLGKRVRRAYRFRASNRTAPAPR